MIHRLGLLGIICLAFPGAGLSQVPPSIPVAPSAGPAPLDGYLQRWEQEMQRIQTLVAQLRLVEKDKTFQTASTSIGVAKYMKTGSGNQTIKLYYDASDGVTDPSNLTICKNTSASPTTWFDIGGSGATLTSGSVTSTSSLKALIDQLAWSLLYFEPNDFFIALCASSLSVLLISIL